jgi:hypothetical protein
MGMHRIVTAGAFAAAVALFSTSASAVVVYDSGGFELPRFTPGLTLQGQDIAPNGPWLKDPGTSSGVVGVTGLTTIAQSGVQAVTITRLAQSGGDTRWAVNKPIVPTPFLNIVETDVDMRVQQATYSGTPPTNTDFGPAFGLEAYDSTNPANPKLIGSLTVDATTGDVLYQQAGTGVLAETGTVVSLGAYHHFKLSVDFTAGKVLSYVDNVLVRTESFVDPTAAAFTDASIGTFAASASSGLTATGTAYLDNFTINQIPEPSTLGVVGLGLVGMLGRRRRRTAAASV